MEEAELEEGEACYYKDDASIDPDIALSYIDEKVQNVLGHFQKDFEGGVSAENLGAKFGGYGSFLPTYQRSWLQPKTPQRAQNNGTPRSPTSFHVEGDPHNCTVSVDEPSSLRLGTASCSTKSLDNAKVTSADAPVTRGSCLLSAQVFEKASLSHGPSSSRSVDSGNQRPLKVRIKVGSDSTARKNAAIYSCFGLSPVSSTGNSSQDSGGMPSESQENPYGSPASILWSMTSFPVPGGLLLSPLHDSMLYLIRNRNLSPHCHPVNPLKAWQNGSGISLDDSASMLGDGKVLKAKKTKLLLGKSGTLNESKHENNMGVEVKMTSPLRTGMEAEICLSKHCIANEVKPKTLSNSTLDSSESLKGDAMTSEAYREAEKDIPVKKREISKDWVKDRLLCTDLVKEETSKSTCQDTGMCEQQDSRRSSVDNIGQHRVRSSSMDVCVNAREGDGRKGERVPAPLKVDPGTPEFAKYSITDIEDHVNRRIFPEAILEWDEIIKPHGTKKSSTEGKKKPKRSQSKSKLTSDLTDKSLRSGVLAASKDTKSDQKEVPSVSNGCKNLLDVRLEQLNNQITSAERPCGDRAEDLGMVKEKEAPGAFVIQEDWVQCDSCEKWRLLPHGMTPEQLPEKWLCNMLNWLPGMNRCDVGEEETTKALQALNQLQSQNDPTGPGIPPVDVQRFPQNQNVSYAGAPSRGKTLYKPKEASNLATNGGLIQTSNIPKNSPGELVKRRSLTDMNQPLPETNAANKVSSQHPSDKQQKKLKGKGQCDEYAFQSAKKIKSEAALDADSYWTSEQGVGMPIMTTIKDMQKRSECRISKDLKHEPQDRLRISVKRRSDTQVAMDSGSLDASSYEEGRIVKKRKLRDWPSDTSHSNGNHLQDSKVFLKEDKNDSEIRKEKKSKVFRTAEECITTNGDNRSNKKGIFARIILSGSRNNLADESVNKDQQLRKRRAKLASQSTLLDVDPSKKDLGPEQLPMAATSSSSKVSDSRKRGRFQDVKGSPVESVSSSPMRVSNPDKLPPLAKGIREKSGAKDSDFHVIESPRRSLDREGNFVSNRSVPGTKGEASNVFHPMSFGQSVLHSRENNARCNSGGKVESSTDTSTRLRPFSTDVRALDYTEDGINTKHHLKSATLPQKSGIGSCLRPQDKDRSSHHNLQKVKVKVSDRLGEQELHPKMIQRNEVRHEEVVHVKHHFADKNSIKHNTDDNCVGKKDYGKWARDSMTKSRDPDGNADRRITQQNMIQNIEGEVAMRRDQTQVESRSVKSRVNPTKQDSLSLDSEGVPAPLEVRSLDLRPVEASGDGDMSQRPKISVHPNGAPNSVGSSMPNRCVVSDPSPVKRGISSQTAMNALKEAESLKDTADRLKNSGFDFESNEAYFQAALKSLYGASLLETCNGESSKHGETAQMQRYISTAKLFETCAHEYEQRHEMAAAALAYKCMEVAFMRVVYCKNVSTNKDRQDLQASLRMVTQGESPSSSASDVDNLNNQATLDKATLPRGMGSQAANHVVVARNRPNFVRLLDFTNDVNSAMEASRKSQNAFVAANLILEKAHNKEGIISVKRVIDFSFQDVEELVRLVRVATEAISRQVGEVGTCETSIGIGDRTVEGYLRARFEFCEVPLIRS
ncbi:hypothetical protein RJ640_014867 [Escallonia rubra]|uniref:CW-type domain-containing protein n=1 Tax=Escallonia rubra TaxID=112253 RepID=A0AA88S4T4_9ASTE|nr:hypothetical protein RJ640_014867 [Escallonia rubra]